MAVIGEAMVVEMAGEMEEGKFCTFVTNYSYLTHIFLAIGKEKTIFEALSNNRPCPLEPITVQLRAVLYENFFKTT